MIDRVQRGLQDSSRSDGLCSIIGIICDVRLEQPILILLMAPLHPKVKGKAARLPKPCPGDPLKSGFPPGSGPSNAIVARASPGLDLAASSAARC